MYTPPEKLGASARDYPTGLFSLASSPVNEVLSYYIDSRGLKTEAEVAKALEIWGMGYTTKYCFINPYNFLW